MAPSSYEQRARAEIEKWKNPKTGWVSRAARAVGKPFDVAGNLVMNAPYVGAVIEKAVGGLVSVTNDVAQWSVRPDAVLAEYRERGHEAVADLGAIRSLDLEHVDGTIGWLGAKYKGLAGAEGAATGLAGALGIAPDIIALITVNLRAIGEYGTYCGFDMTSQQERLYAMNMLGLASSPTDAAKATSMAQLAKIASDVARRKTWKDLERHAFVKLIQKIAQALGVRRTKAKLAQIVPMAGAAVGAGFNAYFPAKCATAATICFASASSTRSTWSLDSDLSRRARSVRGLRGGVRRICRARVHRLLAPTARVRSVRRLFPRVERHEDGEWWQA